VSAPTDAPGSRKALRMGSLAVALALGLLALYAAVCAALFFAQRSLIYHPQPARGSSADVITLAASGATLQVTTRPHAGAGAVLYFGGNAEDVSWSLPTLAAAFP
jgi:hypothetical protein